jgi:hypothetical protein
MSEENSTAFQGGGGAFSTPDPALINDITNIMKNNQQSSLPSHLEQSAKQAGELAANARTLEDKQNIYKNYLSKSNSGNQETTSKMVADWEKSAEYHRKNKR